MKKEFKKIYKDVCIYPWRHCCSQKHSLICFLTLLMISSFLINWLFNIIHHIPTSQDVKKYHQSENAQKETNSNQQLSIFVIFCLLPKFCDVENLENLSEQTILRKSRKSSKCKNNNNCQYFYLHIDFSFPEFLASNVSKISHCLNISN